MVRTYPASLVVAEKYADGNGPLWVHHKGQLVEIQAGPADVSDHAFTEDAHPTEVVFRAWRVTRVVGSSQPTCLLSARRAS